MMVGGFTSFQVNGQTPAQNKTVKQQTVKYTCPMHPEVIQDKPGKCPKCGMELVEKKGSANKHQAHDSTTMNQGNMKMMKDSTANRKGHMMRDTSSMKH